MSIACSKGRMSEQRPQKIAVLGAGSWGTALAAHLARGKHSTVLWGRNEAFMAQLAVGRIHAKCFPETLLPGGLGFSSDLSAVVADADMVVLSVPVGSLEELCASLVGKLKPGALIVSTAKGIKDHPLQTMSEVIGGAFGGRNNVVVLSGPSFAVEVLHAKPTAVTLAADSLQTAERASQLFHSSVFRTYTSTDVKGIELGGALKNVVALAAGVVDGAQMGANARAALVTRGLAEMRRLIDACGGKPESVMGLSGLGDLMLTCSSDLSRNRRVGLRLGQGDLLDDILRDLGQVAEGVTAAGSALRLAQEHRIEVPIIEAMSQFLAGQMTLSESIHRLLSRTPKQES